MSAKIVPFDRAKREMLAKLEELIERVNADKIATLVYVVEGIDSDGDTATGYGWQVSDRSHMTTVLGAVQLTLGDLTESIISDARG